MPLRTILALPAAGSGLEEALASEADALLFTLADASVEIAAARKFASEAIDRTAAAGKTPLVIVNHPRTGLLRDDIEAVTRPALRGVLLPHTVEPQDIRDLAVHLREFELKRGIEPGDIAAYPVVDTARGLLRAPEIVEAAPRVAGLVFDAPAYSRDIHARHEESGNRLAYARGAVVAAARAHERRPLIITEPMQALEIAQSGFSGIVLNGISGIRSANSAFTPSAAAVEHARAQVAAYEAARQRGDYVARLGTEIVDANTARKARQLLG